MITLKAFKYKDKKYINIIIEKHYKYYKEIWIKVTNKNEESQGMDGLSTESYN